jgi:hypothetical protein
MARQGRNGPKVRWLAMSRMAESIAEVERRVVQVGSQGMGSRGAASMELARGKADWSADWLIAGLPELAYMHVDRRGAVGLADRSADSLVVQLVGVALEPLDEFLAVDVKNEKDGEGNDGQDEDLFDGHRAAIIAVDAG